MYHVIRLIEEMGKVAERKDGGEDKREGKGEDKRDDKCEDKREEKM